MHPNKLKLMEVSDVCYWCGCKLKIYERSNAKGDIIPDDLFTIDHVFCHGTKERQRYQKLRRNSPIVVSCHKCNSNRGCKGFQKYKNKLKNFVETNKVFCLYNKGWELIENLSGYKDVKSLLNLDR